MTFVLSKYLQNRAGRTHHKKELERGTKVSLDTTADEIIHSNSYRFGFGEHTLFVSEEDWECMKAHVELCKRMKPNG